MSSLQADDVETSGPPLPPQRKAPATSRGPLASLFFSSSQEETTTPADDPTTSPAPSTAEQTPDETTPAGPGVVSWGSPPDEPSDELPGEHDGPPTGSEATTPADRKPFSSSALRRVFRRGVIIGGGMAHQALARTQGQRAVGLYETDKDDAENIGDPLSRIAGRRGGIGGKAANPDVEDAVSALMGLANFVTKQIVLAGVAAKIDAGEPVPAGLVAVAGDDEAAA